MKRHYLELWLVLAVGLAVIAAISWFGGVDEPWLKLKSSGLVESLTKPYEAKAAVEDADTVEQQIKPLLPAPVDTAAQTILIVGDSMLEGLYPRLAAYCDASGHSLYAVIWYSSTTEIWGRTHRLSDYIKELNPTYIFISLGANEMFVKDIAEKRTGYVEELMRQVGDIPYVWIGPPNWKADTGINDMLQSNLPEGSFFLTNGMKFRRKKDGAHPVKESAAEWVDSIVRWMPEHCSHPIRLEQPEKKYGSAKRVFVHQPDDNP